MKKLLYVFQVVRSRGIIFLFDYFRESVLFDLVNGTDTAIRREKNVETVDSQSFDDGLLYVGSFSSTVRASINAALRQSTETPRLFIDVGCGKGKVLMFVEKAYEDTFARVLGIEYDNSLVEIARENILKLNLPKSEVIEASAENLEMYLSEPAIIYFYNSFQGATFRNCFERIAPLPFLLVYVDPACEPDLVGLGYEVICAEAGRYNADTWSILKSPGWR